MELDRWRHRISESLSTLTSMGPGRFYDEESDRYHEVYNELAAISNAFELNHADLFPNQSPTGRECWLPDEVSNLASMSAAEICWRLRENIADERWVDGALSDAFGNGVLTAALERILADIDSFTVASNSN